MKRLYYNTTEVAAALQMTVTSVTRLVRLKKLKGKLVGGRYMITPESIEKYTGIPEIMSSIASVRFCRK